MINQIGGSGSFDPSSRRQDSSKPKGDLFKEKMQKIEKTEKQEQLDHRKMQSPFPHPEMASPQLPAFLDPSRGPAEAKIERPSNSTIPPEGFERIARDVIATPPRYPPPTLEETILRPATSSKELPQSEHFWEDFDLPDEPPPKPNLEEGIEEDEREKGSGKEHEEEMASLLLRPATRKEQKKLENPETKQEVQRTFFTPPEKTEEEKESVISAKSKTSDRKDVGQGPEEDISSTLLRPATRKEQKMIEFPEPKEQHRSFFTSPEKKQKTKGAAERSDEDEENRKKTKVYSLPIPDPLPTQIGSIAKSAGGAAASYLNPETEALFNQMVGAIIFVQNTKTGVSRTEVILNSSNLIDSPFYNAMIIIEQHASAAGSLNICLVGSPEAVQIFNTNLPRLTAAFAFAYENKQIDFRIGRLETALSKGSSSPRKQESKSDQDDDWIEE